MQARRVERSVLIRRMTCCTAWAYLPKSAHLRMIIRPPGRYGRSSTWTCAARLYRSGALLRPGYFPAANTDSGGGVARVHNASRVQHDKWPVINRVISGNKYKVVALKIFGG